MKKALLFIGIIAVLGAATWQMYRRGNLTTMPPTSSGSGSSGSSSSSSGGSNTTTTSYKDGTYNRSVASAYYGNVQVQVVIAGGKIQTVTFLQYPNDNPTSTGINQQATTYLQQEAIQAQSGNVNTVSGATLTSEAFNMSLAVALRQAS